MTCQPSEPVTLDGILRALETETAKLASLQSLCGVVAESAGTFSDAEITGSVFAIMNNIEAIKDRLADIVRQVMVFAAGHKVMTRERAELLLLAVAMPDEMIPTMTRAAIWICPGLARLPKDNPLTLELVRQEQVPLWGPEDLPEELPGNVDALFPNEEARP